MIKSCLYTVLLIFLIQIGFGQITLKKDENSKYGQIESIVFSPSKDKNPVRSEFKLDEFDRFEKYGFQEEVIRGKKIYKPTISQAKQYLKDANLDENQIELDQGKLGALQFKMAKSNGSFATFVSQTALAIDGERIESSRSSDIVVFNDSGEKVLELLRLPYDINRFDISQNGKYLYYEYGSLEEHTSFNVRSGFVVYDIQGRLEHLNIQAESDAISISDDVAQVGYFRNGKYNILLHLETTNDCYYKTFDNRSVGFEVIDSGKSIKVLSQRGEEIFIINELNRFK